MNNRLREVHHRIKNHFQVLSSRMAIEARTVESACCRRRLRKHQSNVQTLVALHEELMTLDQRNRLPLGTVLTRVLERSVQALGVDRDISLSLDLMVDSPEWDPDRVLGLSMVLNELVTNSIQHGFEDRDGGTILVTARETDDGGLELEYSDDGRGFPADSARVVPPESGLGLVRSIVEDELAGSLTLVEPETARIRMELPLDGES